MRKFAKAEEEAEVNMTPMLDIVFIMLIFFIVTATFIKESGLDVNTPPDTNSPPPPPDEETRAIAFVIDGTGRVRFEFRPIDVSAATAIIKKESVERPQAPVVIQAEKGAGWGIALRIYDDALAAGISPERVVMTKRQ